MNEWPLWCNSQVTFSPCDSLVYGFKFFLGLARLPTHTSSHTMHIHPSIDRYRIIKRLCLIGGFLLFIRYFLSFVPALNTMDLRSQPSTEWLRGNNLCTFKTSSMVHLGWSVPMADPSYYVMGASIHSFLMFAPFFALYEKKGMILQGKHCGGRLNSLLACFDCGISSSYVLNAVFSCLHY